MLTQRGLVTSPVRVLPPLPKRKRHDKASFEAGAIRRIALRLPHWGFSRTKGKRARSERQPSRAFVSLGARTYQAFLPPVDKDARADKKQH